MILKKFSPRQNVQKFREFTQTKFTKQTYKNYFFESLHELHIQNSSKIEALAANSRQKLIPPSQNGKLKNA